MIGGVKLNVKDKYLAHTLFDLTQTATIADSLKIGKQMLRQLGEINRLHRNEVEQAGFAVLKGAGYSVRAGGNRLYQQSGGRSQADQFQPSGQDRRRAI